MMIVLSLTRFGLSMVVGCSGRILGGFRRCAVCVTRSEADAVDDMRRGGEVEEREGFT